MSIVHRFILKLITDFAHKVIGWGEGYEYYIVGKPCMTTTTTAQLIFSKCLECVFGHLRTNNTIADIAVAVKVWTT